MEKIAVISNILSHYRQKCFYKLVQKLNKKIYYYFLAEKMEHRNMVLIKKPSGLPSIYLSGWKWRRPPKDDRHINNIMPIIRGSYNILILGAWDEPSYLLLWLWGVVAKKKIIFWIESTIDDARRIPIKERYKKLLFKKASACIVPGRKAYEYCRVLGMAPDRIFFAPNATDRDFFRNRADSLFPRRPEIREEFGFSGVIILFVGRLVDEYKNVSFLIRAFDNLKNVDEKVNLVIVGNGPDRGKFEEMVKKRGISGVQFLGEMDHDQLCRVYAASDIMVLPSKCEPWGFVLNEAMEFGLPLVVTDRVGAGPDLVHPGENGFIVPSGDEAALVKALGKLINDPGLRTTMGQASRKIVEHFSPENWAAGVVSAIEAVDREPRC